MLVLERRIVESMADLEGAAWHMPYPHSRSTAKAVQPGPILHSVVHEHDGCS